MRADPPPTSRTRGASYSSTTSSANSRRLKSPGRSVRWSACSSSYRWSNENALRRKCSRTRPVESVDVAIGLMVRDEPVCARDVPQPALDERAARVPPGDDFGGSEPLLAAGARWQLGSQPRPELVRVEVQDGEVAQVPGRQQAPVASAAGHRELP